MSKLTEAQISEQVDKLLTFAETLPLGEKGKSYIKGKIIIDFWDTWQFDDEANVFSIGDYLKAPKKYSDVKVTYGIENAGQIKRYIDHLIAALRKSRLAALDNYLQKLDELKPAEKALQLSKVLASVNRSEIMAKHGLRRLKEPQWNEQLKDILGNELSFAKDQAELLEQHTKTVYKEPKIWEEDLLAKVEIAVQFGNPTRHDLLKKTLKEIEEGLKICPEEYEQKLSTVHKNYLKIIDRLNKAAVHFEGFTSTEIHFLLDMYAKEFYYVLHSDNLTDFIEDKINELRAYQESIEQDLTNNKFEIPADRMDAKSMLYQVGRYKKYLEIVVNYYKGIIPHHVDTAKQAAAKINMDKEIYLVEELELRLSIEAVQYKKYFDGFPPIHDFDPQHFNRFITGPLLNEYIQTIYERTKKLNNAEISRYLNISYSQFQTHKPELRKDVIKEQYWKDYCYPNPPYIPYQDIDESHRKYFEHVMKWYEKHFHLFEEATNKALEDFKAGLIGTPSAPIPAPQLEKPTEKIKYESFNIFIKGLEYNYQYTTPAMSFKYSMKENLDYLKREILSNLIVLSKEERKPYLNRLRFDIANHQQHVWSTAETLEKWYDKYNSPKENDTFFKDTSNELYQILTSDKPKFRETYEPGFNQDTEQIQDEFYNYYYGYYIEAALSFIDDQIAEVDPASVIQQNGQQKNPRIKTNLSVPQLALLFKMLNDIKPNIFDVKSEAELHRFISANFVTKKSTENGISIDKLRQLFNQPDSKAADIWEKYLQTMIAQARKLKRF